MKKATGILVFVIFLITVFSVSAQDNIPMEETLKFINDRLGGKSTVEVLHGTLIFKAFEGGEVKREDKVEIKEIDADAVVYFANEKAVILPCKKGKDECVDRRLYVSKIRRFYNRVNVVSDGDDKAGEALARALKHMVKLVQDPKYKNAVPFEK